MLAICSKGYKVSSVKVVACWYDFKADVYDPLAKYASPKLSQ